MILFRVEKKFQKIKNLNEKGEIRLCSMKSTQIPLKFTWFQLGQTLSKPTRDRIWTPNCGRTGPGPKALGQQTGNLDNS